MFFASPPHLESAAHQVEIHPLSSLTGDDVGDSKYYVWIEERLRFDAREPLWSWVKMAQSIGVISFVFIKDRVYLQEAAQS
jgi:hypothetical protein